MGAPADRRSRTGKVARRGTCKGVLSAPAGRRYRPCKSVLMVSSLGSGSGVDRVERDPVGRVIAAQADGAHCFHLRAVEALGGRNAGQVGGGSAPMKSLRACITSA